MLFWKSITIGLDMFSLYTSFDIGDGIQFCHDSWCGNQPLRVAFPILYDCSLAGKGGGGFGILMTRSKIW